MSLTPKGPTSWSTKIRAGPHTNQGRTMTNTRSGMTHAAIEEMINQRVNAALEAHQVNQNLELGNNNGNNNGNGNGNDNGNGNGNGLVFFASLLFLGLLRIY
ncbi:hypothetical protein Tco_0010708 [Tanacetum coccineum]